MEDHSKDFLYYVIILPCSTHNYIKTIVVPKALGRLRHVVLCLRLSDLRTVISVQASVRPSQTRQASAQPAVCFCYCCHFVR